FVLPEDVEPTAAPDRLLAHRLHVASLAEVDDGRHPLAALGADLLGGALRAVKLQLGDAHLRALAREHQRDGATDALTGTCDDGDLAVETTPPPRPCSIEPAGDRPRAPLLGEGGVLPPPAGAA